jgi:hypothetical protein
MKLSDGGAALRASALDAAKRAAPGASLPSEVWADICRLQTCYADPSPRDQGQLSVPRVWLLPSFKEQNDA